MSDVLTPPDDTLLDRRDARPGNRRRRSYPVQPPPPPQRARRNRYHRYFGPPPRLGWPRGLAAWQEFLRFRLLPAGIMLGAPAAGAMALMVAVTIAVLHLSQPRPHAAAPIPAAAATNATSPAVAPATDRAADDVGLPQAASYETLLASFLELNPARLDDAATIHGYAARYDCSSLRAAANEFRRAAIFETTRALDPAKASYTVRESVSFGDYDFAAQKFPIRLPPSLHLTIAPATAHTVNAAAAPVSSYCPAREGLPSAFTVTMDNVSGLTGLAIPPEQAERFIAARTVRAHDGLHTEADRTLTAEITFRVVAMADRRRGEAGMVAEPTDSPDIAEQAAAQPVTAEAEMIGFRLFDAHDETLYAADPGQLAARVADARVADAARPILARFDLEEGPARDGATRLVADQLPLLYAALSLGAPPLGDYLQALPSVQALPLFSTERRLLIERLHAPLAHLASPIVEHPDRIWRVSVPVRLPRPARADDMVALRGLAADTPGLTRDLGAGHYALAFDPPGAVGLPAGLAEDAVAANGGMRVMAADLLLRPERAELTADGQRLVVMRLVAVELRARADGRLILRHDVPPGVSRALTAR